MIDPLLRPVCTNARAWVESTLRMPAVTSPTRPGPISLSRQPWMDEPLSAFLDPGLEHLYLCMGAQCGKTTLCLLGSAALMTFDPAPMLWALPSEELAARHANTRFFPFWKNNPSLAAMLPREHTYAETLTSRAPIYFVGARVPAKLASLPVAYIIADEEAKFTQHDKHEAHPSLLLGERQKTFARRLFVHASTPNTEDNLFWRGYLDSDQRHYYIPCPHCGQYQTIKFTRETLVWDHPPGEPVTDAIVETTARYICPHCGGAWDDHQLKSAMTRGEWRAHNPDASPTRRGYHLSSLYSPDVSLGQFAVEFVRASRDQFAAQRLQNFWNSWLAEPYTRHTIRVDDSNIYALTGEHLRGHVPTGDYHYIIVTYDPGQTSTHWMATAIGPAGSMLVIDYGTILGITSDPSTGQLGIWDHYQSLSWTGPDGTRHTPAIGYIDSGDWTTQVYAECEKSGKILAPTKGSSAPYGSFAQTPVKSTPGLDLIVYSDHVLKRELYGEIINRRRLAELILPADITDDLVAGLSGQTLETRPNGEQRWKKLPNDHYGDCLKLARVSWWIMRRHLEPAAPAPDTLHPPTP